MVEMRDAGILDTINQWTPAWNTSYTNGSVMFYPCATWSIRWQLQANDPEGTKNWRLMIPPEGGVNWGGGAGCITKDSKNKEAAWIVLKNAGLSVECAKAYMSDLQWFSIFKSAYDDPALQKYNLPYLGNQDIVDFYVRRVEPSIMTRACTSNDAAIEQAIALVRQNMLTNASIKYDQAIKLIKDEIKTV
jgi:multiple sugar transport system substrate-binding protein